MRTLGIDYGSKRVGLAISDELGVLARELEVVANPQALSRIKQIITELEVGEIVMGLPIGLGGQDTQKTKEVQKFLDVLKKEVSVPVKAVDERMSTQMALKIPGGDRGTDSLAAQIILQTYLDKNHV
jgi:putative Holliday junction resolvase